MWEIKIKWEISSNLQEINKVCDKYPVNFNSICLLCYNKGNHSCKYELKIKITTHKLCLGSEFCSTKDTLEHISKDITALE